MLQRPPQEALSETYPPQTGVYTPDGPVLVSFQSSAEVLQSCGLSGTTHQTAATLAQVLHPESQFIRAGGRRLAVALNDRIQISHCQLVGAPLSQTRCPLAEVLQSVTICGLNSNSEEGNSLSPLID